MTDGGAQFVNKLVKRICDTYGTTFRRTPIAHSHQHNAKVENANRQVLKSLRAYLFDERVMDDWTRALPAVQFIFNTTKHRDIGYTSADLLFGPAMNLNRFVLDQKDLPESVEPMAWWDEQQGIHQQILIKAAALQKEVVERRKESLSKLSTKYDLQSYVLVEYPKTMGEGGRPLNKLQTTRKGPMKVVDAREDAYDLLDLVTRKVNTVHVSRLHPFMYDKLLVDPENVAIRD